MPLDGTLHDAVSPHHYKSRGLECIELVEMLPFCEGNAVKYLWRCGLKGPALEDLKKALWYVERARTSDLALHTHRRRPFTWILQRALDEFCDETQREAIRTISLGKLSVAKIHLEQMIKRASPVPSKPSASEACTPPS